MGRYTAMDRSRLHGPIPAVSVASIKRRQQLDIALQFVYNDSWTDTFHIAEQRAQAVDVNL